MKIIMFSGMRTHSSWITGMRIRNLVNIKTSHVHICALPQSPADVCWDTGRPPQPQACRLTAAQACGHGWCAQVPQVAPLKLLLQPLCLEMGLKFGTGGEWRKNIGWSNIKDVVWLLTGSQTNQKKKKKPAVRKALQMWEGICGCTCSPVCW